MTRWDEVYRKKENVYGAVGAGLVWQHLQAAPPGPVLDLGCGEGRNGLMAAVLGRTTLGLDLSPVAVARANQAAARLDLPFRADVADLTAYPYPESHYAFICAAFVLPFWPKTEVARQLRLWRRALIPGGMLYASALTTEDPDYALHTGQYEEREPGSFFKPELGEYRTFFAPGEVLRLVQGAGLTMVEGHEGIFLDEHPSPHYHCQAQVVARA